MSFVGENWKEFLVKRSSRVQKPLESKKVNVSKYAPSTSVSSLPMVSSLGKAKNEFFVKNIAEKRERGMLADRSAATKKLNLEDAPIVDLAPGMQALDEKRLPPLLEPVSLYCDMVNVGDTSSPALARLVVVARNGRILYDRFVAQVEKVVDYRVAITNIKKDDLTSENAVSLTDLYKDIAKILKNRIFITSNAYLDSKLLNMHFEKHRVRDIATYERFCANRKVKKLSILAEEYLNIKMYNYSRNSVEDARLIMKLYLQERDRWEANTELQHGEKLRDLRKKIAKMDKTANEDKLKKEQSLLNRKARQQKRAERRKISSDSSRWLTNDKNSDDSDSSDSSDDSDDDDRQVKKQKTH